MVLHPIGQEARRRAGVVVGLIAVMAATMITGCSADNGDAATRDSPRPDLQVVTTVSPLTSIVANIAGPDVAVTGLVPEGVNSHTFEPPPSAARALAEADIVFVNGLGLEDPTEDLAKANLAPGAEIVKLGDEVLPRSEWIFDFSFPREGGKPNPHLWTNPPMVAEYAAVIRDALITHDAANAATYRANHDAFAARIKALDSAMADATATIPKRSRTLLTYHDAYAYFAQTYDWEIIGAIQVSDFEDPSPGEVADLIEQVRDSGVPAIFGSEVFPSPVLERIGEEADVSYVDSLRDDDLPGEPGDPEHSWLGLMRFNFITMTDALGGDSSALEGVAVTSATPDEAEYPQ